MVRGTAVLALLLATGCGQDGPKLAPVRGTVYYKGVPLKGGTIVFAPDPERGGQGPLAVGEVRPDGTYLLRTEGDRGAVPGWHRITVSPADARSAFPRRYADPELSGLSREVQPERANTIDLRLD
jgi:hypothetical protein